MQTQDKTKGQKKEKPKTIINKIPNWPVGLSIPNSEKLSVSIAEESMVGDLSDDGEVNFKDLARLVDNWLWIGEPGSVPEDITRDGVINLADFGKLAENWMK